ncbi:MAG: transcriptional repressor, partial [Actinomycetota bacterium]|nr:transcriptional repressor [Actinomycetota bacterium]
MRDEAATQRLRQSGLRVTRPRLAVLAVLDDAARRSEHIVVADVAQRARRLLGSLSTQATYDCLGVLTGAGLARRIELPGHPARYEARV